MAVPKKKTSKTKRNQRKAANWKRKATLEAQKALSLGKSILTGRANGFVYPVDEAEDESAD
jgi:large subunit ribosomal protein L32